MGVGKETYYRSSLPLPASPLPPRRERPPKHTYLEVLSLQEGKLRKLKNSMDGDGVEL